MRHATLGAAGMGLAMLVFPCLPLEKVQLNAFAADNWTPTARIYGEEGCKDKNDFNTFRMLGDAFQRELKPVLQSGLMTPEKFDAMYELSDLNQWLKKQEASGNCVALKDRTEVAIDERSDQIICVRPQAESSCFWIRNTAIRPEQ
jgi:hypothetical protein